MLLKEKKFWHYLKDLFTLQNKAMSQTSNTIESLS